MRCTSQFHPFQKREELLKVPNSSVIESNGLRLKKQQFKLDIKKISLEARAIMP